MSKRNTLASKKARRIERNARKLEARERYGPMRRFVRRDNNKYPKVAETKEAA